jgi:hypothetical protein
MPQFCDLKKPLQKKDICGVKLERPYVAVVDGTDAYAMIKRQIESARCRPRQTTLFGGARCVAPCSPCALTRALSMCFIAFVQQPCVRARAGALQRVVVVVRQRI